MIKSNLFVKKKRNYLRYQIDLWGNPFYILVEKDEEGNVKQMMEKPNFKEIKKGVTIVSGMHIIPNHPERNHIDCYENGKKIRMEESNIIPYWIKEFDSLIRT